jgi:hypothetical protein
LQQAGFAALHWPDVVNGVDYQAQVQGKETDAEAVTAILAPVIAAYDALSDAPISVLYQALHRAYPDALFLLVHRSPYDWLRSIRKHIQNRALIGFEKVQYWHYLPSCPADLTAISDDALLAMHLQHHGDILRYFAGNSRFHLFHLPDPQIGEKICQFLNVPPLPFPNIDYARG